MISDILSEAVAEIRRYLDDPVFAGTYTNSRREIERVAQEMDKLRAELDRLPVADSPRPGGS
jgi:cell fate (sporulation/competence/biofilm development) regulator YmcA (YheA/YmcA/DUF963 family)